MKKKQFKISVIVPVYNKKKYLPECIESILGQTCQNIELILVDDGSADGSDEICEAYAQKDERVRLIRQANAGPTAACVTGMKQAAGDYYMFVDSDDYIESITLQEMAERLRGRQGEIVCCGHVLEKQKGTQMIAAGSRPGAYEGSRLQELKKELLGNECRIIPMSRCMKLYEKSVFEGNEKYYDMSIRMGDDFHMIYPAMLAATRIVIMKDAYFYHYRYVETSIVHKYYAGMADSVKAWYHAMQHIVEDKHVADAEQKLRQEYCYMLLYVIKNELRSPDRGYLKRIQEIFREEEIYDIVQNTPLKVSSRASWLLYLGMVYPAGGLLRLLRFIVKVYDRKK